MQSLDESTYTCLIFLYNMNKSLGHANFEGEVLSKEFYAHLYCTSIFQLPWGFDVDLR